MAEMTRTEIKAPFPNVAAPELHLELNSCRLAVRPGDGDGRVTGSYDDAEGTMPLSVEQNGRVLRIKQRPSLSEMLRVEDRMVPLDLAVGAPRPFALQIHAGATTGSLELGGLPLMGLEIKTGKGEQEISFSAPNPGSLERIHITGPVGRVALRGLANANFSRLDVDAAEASCLLECSGTLRRPGQAKITCVQGSIEIVAPAGVAVRIKVDDQMGVLDVGPGFTKKSGAYWTRAAVAGEGPALDVRASVVMGEIRLRSSE